MGRDAMMMSVEAVLVIWVIATSSAMVTAAAANDEGDDLTCLREFKASVTDPLGYLHNWDFRGGASINFCNFVGVTCLNRDAPEVHHLNLAGAGLGGRFPRALRKCSGLKGLDLSSNFFTGRIPPTVRLCAENPQLVQFDLSNNAFSGKPPSGVQVCPHRSSTSWSSKSSPDYSLEARSSRDHLTKLDGEFDTESDSILQNHAYQSGADAGADTAGQHVLQSLQR